MPRPPDVAAAGTDPAVSVVQVLGLYVGVPALLFGAIALVVLASARPAPRTGSPVLRRGPAPAGDEQAAPADAPEVPLGSPASAPSTSDGRAGA